MSDHLKPFMRRIKRASETHKVSWEADPVASGTFVAKATTGAVKLRQSRGRSGGLVTTLELLNDEGAVVDMLETDPSNPGPWQDWESDLMALYDLARYAATGATDVVRSLEEEWQLPPDPGDEIPF